ncbi:hypothetical protein [Burkholderia sp. MSMB1498]|uniref:hypothetical protein n=1 Tax=Burkholderia sp. MSMB1498 TaxID=1637842 RepID=UPI0012E3BE2D|nr:hypothetical protein [Burkholderia sp. MSMB1498]
MPVRSRGRDISVETGSARVRLRQRLEDRRGERDFKRRAAIGATIDARGDVRRSGSRSTTCGGLRLMPAIGTGFARVCGIEAVSHSRRGGCGLRCSRRSMLMLMATAVVAVRPSDEGDVAT